MGSALLVQLCILSQIGFFRENANTLKNLVFTFPMKFQFCHFWSCPLQRVFTLQRAVTGHSGNTGTSHHQPHTRLNSKAYACVCIVTCNENAWRCSLQWPMCDVLYVVCWLMWCDLTVKLQPGAPPPARREQPDRLERDLGQPRVLQSDWRLWTLELKTNLREDFDSDYYYNLDSLMGGMVSIDF